MRVAGFGFRQDAGTDSLAAALALTGAHSVTHLATLASKSELSAMQGLAKNLDLPIISVAKGALTHVPVVTRSEKSIEIRGTGSVAEASALAAAGENARLVVLRVVSPDGMATCAIAEGTEE